MPRQQSSLLMSLRCVAVCLDKIDHAASQPWRDRSTALAVAEAKPFSGPRRLAFPTFVIFVGWRRKHGQRPETFEFLGFKHVFGEDRAGRFALAIERQDVEGIQLDFVIVLARVQGIEIGNTVNPKDESFAINELIRSTSRTTRRVLQTSQK